VRPAVECLEDRTLPSITATSFAGLAFDLTQGATPPDTIAASGPAYIVEGVNNNIRFVNKTTLASTQQTFANFFGITGSGTITDPSVNYDEVTGKFIVSILEVGSSQSFLHVAVSNSNDPTGAWSKTSITLTESGAKVLIPGNAGSTLYGDFDRFGSSSDAYVWTVNMFTYSTGTDYKGNPPPVNFNSLFDHVQIIAVDKNITVDGSGNLTSKKNLVDAIGWNTTTQKIVNENLMPVRMHNPSDTTMWFDEEADYGDPNSADAKNRGHANALQLIKIPDILAATSADFDPAISPAHFYTVTVPTYGFNFVVDPSNMLGNPFHWNDGDVNPAAPQNGSPDTIQTNDTRLLSQAWRNIGGQEHLVITQTVTSVQDVTVTSSTPPQEIRVAKARWYDINTGAVGGPALYQSGELDPGPGVATYFPSADIAPNGDIGMTYLESSANEFLSMWITGKNATDSRMQAPLLVRASTTAYTMDGDLLEPSPHRAGDFSGTVVDVNSAGTPINAFVSANEFATTVIISGVWGTQIASYSIQPNPGTLIEDFDSSRVYHLVFPLATFPPDTFQPSQSASHEGLGDYGLINNPGSDWIYRDDPAAKIPIGHSIFVWLQFHNGNDGVATFAFDANSSTNNSYAIAVSTTGTGSNQRAQLTLEKEDFTGTGTTTRIGSPATGTADIIQGRWYHLEVDWGTGQAITAKLFDSNGTQIAILGPTTGTLSTVSGGFGFNATSTGTNQKYWDTVTDPPAFNTLLVAQPSPAFAANHESATAPNLGVELAGALSSLVAKVPPTLYHAVDAYFANRHEATLPANVTPVESSHLQGLMREPQASGMGTLADPANTEDTPELQAYWPSS
jgi:hypothetical protein